MKVMIKNQVTKQKMGKREAHQQKLWSEIN